jgi:hypothetical protein
MDFWLVSAHIAPVNAILFDTLRLSRTLADKGHFTPEQAEALAEAEAAHEDRDRRGQGRRPQMGRGAIGFQTIVILGAPVSLVRIFAK